MFVVNNISLALISMFGGLLFFYNMLTAGSISSFVVYSRKFSGPINEFANILSDIQNFICKMLSGVQKKFVGELKLLIVLACLEF